MDCPFQIGDRVHEIRYFGLNIRAEGTVTFVTERDNAMLWELDPTKPDATVIALTARGFEYRYDHPIPFGRAADGCVAHGGTCYPGGFHLWRKVS